MSSADSSTNLTSINPRPPTLPSPFTPEEEERYLKMHWELLDFNDGKIPEPKYPREDFLRFRDWQQWNLLKDYPERQQAYVDSMRELGLL